MKPLRILYIVTSFPSVTETFIASQVADMIDRGHDCSIFAYNPSTCQIRHQLVMDYELEQRTVTHFKNFSSGRRVWNAMWQFFWKYKFQLRYGTLLSLVNPFTFQRKAAHRKAYWDLPIFLLDKKYDVIHCHFGFNGLKVARLKKLGILTNERCIVSFHGSDLTPSKVSLYKVLYDDLFAQFDAFTVNTLFLKGILEQVQSNLKNVHVLPVGFHERYLQPYLDLPKYPIFTLVYCGRLMLLKGPDRALQILMALIDQGLDIQLLMIGEGSEEQALRAQAQQLGLENHVIWLGALTQEIVFQHMSQAHVFLYPGITELGTGRAETQGLVIQEAQYLKLPVVVSNTGGVKYGLLDGETGYLIKDNSLEEYVEKILYLYKNFDTRVMMGEKGHQWAASLFLSKSLGSHHEKIYFNQI